MYMYKLNKNVLYLRIFFPLIKMENYEKIIVSTLKNLARERGLRRYSRLRKSELIRTLREPTPVEATGKRERFTRIL